jgi:pantothenate kinase type III
MPVTVKPRDIRTACGGNVHPNVVKYMEALAEDQIKLSQGMIEMSQMLDKMVDTMQNVVNGVVSMRSEFIKTIYGREESAESMLKRKEPPPSSDDPNTH